MLNDTKDKEMLWSEVVTPSPIGLFEVVLITFVIGFFIWCIWDYRRKK